MTDMAVLLSRLDALDDLPDMSALRERGYELLDLNAGDTVVDVGCGGGRAAAELAQRGARSHGVDAGQEMIDAARKRWTGAEFQVASAEHLPFGDAACDGYRVDKVLHALDDPRAAVREAHRVLKPGGRAVLVGQDWDFIAVDADNPEAVRRLIRARADKLPNPNIASGYANLLRDNGFTDVTLEVHPTMPAPEAVLSTLSDAADAVPEGHDLLAEQRERAAAGRMTVVMPMFLAAGTRK